MGGVLQEGRTSAPDADPTGDSPLSSAGTVSGMSDVSVRRHLIVHGRVQGVFFRAATRDEAVAAGVAGWVRNREDGSVEAVFEGPPDAVERLVAFARGGPPHAQVDDVEVREEAPEGLRDFDVR